jgi:hypothetical protein
MMLTNAELQELAHFKAKLRRTMNLNVELSTLATNKTYCREILTQAEDYAVKNNDDDLKAAVHTIRSQMGFLEQAPT